MRKLWNSKVNDHENYRYYWSFHFICCQVTRALNNSNDHVLALASNFSFTADSHLVCIQSNRDESYHTQAINIHNKPRKGKAGTNIYVYVYVRVFVIVCSHDIHRHNSKIRQKRGGVKIISQCYSMVNYHLQGRETKEHYNVDWRTEEKPKGGMRWEQWTVQ